MKRLIRYHNRYTNDGPSFTNTGTQYEVLPVLVPDEAGEAELLALAKRYGATGDLKVLVAPPPPWHAEFNATHTLHHDGTVTEKGVPAVKWRRSHGALNITHAVQIDTIVVPDSIRREVTEVPQFLGFVTLVSSEILQPSRRPNRTIKPEVAWEIASQSEFGVAAVGEQVDGGNVVVARDWDYFHALPLHGFSLEKFAEAVKADDQGFEDDTYQCSGCYKFDDRDDGCSENFRVLNSELLGLRCGCFEEAVVDGDIEDFVYVKGHEINPIELKIGHKLVESGKLVFVDRYVGGWADRGGYWRGPDERKGLAEGTIYGTVLVGNPEAVLAEKLEKNPDAQFVISHDESGQFQQYWSLWKVPGEEDEVETTTEDEEVANV